jgi:SAM-dependent methyltransferase
MDAFDRFERAGWAETDVGAYDEVLGPITRRAIEPLLDATGVRAGARVLDVATGPGYVARAAAARGADVIGVDASPAMLALARRGAPALRFEEATAEALGDLTGFDAVVASFLILHVSDPERVAAELARAAAPGGRVGLTAWGPPDRGKLFAIVPEAVRAAGASAPPELPAGPDFFRFADDGEFVRLFAGAGLDDARVETLEVAHEIAGPDELWRGLVDGTVRTRALVRGQTPDTQRAIRAAFERALETYRAGDRYAIPVAIKIASARKPR